MIHVAADSTRRLLLIRYTGTVSPQQTEQALDDIRSGLATLERGFRLLVDLTDLQTMDVACAPFVEKAMDLCNEKGASMVVRVIPDPRRDIGMQIMSIFHYSGDTRILTCETLAQAEQILSEP
jgi:anti-anti-sigma regulatory factor